MSYILLFVVLAVLFDAKSTKNFGTRKKSSQAPFAHATIGEHSVGRLLATPGFRLFAGCCGPLISAAILKIIYTRANLQTCLAQWPANKRPCIGFFNGAVSLSATDYSLLALRDYLCKRTDRVRVMLEQSEASKNAGLLRLANPHSKSNFKKNRHCVSNCCC